MNDTKMIALFWPARTRPVDTAQGPQPPLQQHL